MRAEWFILGLATALVISIVLAQPTITITPTITYPGGSITITIEGYDGEYCAVEIRDPADSLAYTKGINLSGGTGTVGWDIPETAILGNYTVYVSCEQSGNSTAILTLVPKPALVGGEVFKDFTPIISTLVVFTAVALIALTVTLTKKEVSHH